MRWGGAGRGGCGVVAAPLLIGAVITRPVAVAVATAVAQAALYQHGILGKLRCPYSHVHIAMFASAILVYALDAHAFAGLVGTWPWRALSPPGCTGQWWPLVHHHAALPCEIVV